MNSVFEINIDDQEAVKVALLGLVVECPLGVKTEKCQLFLMRMEPLSDRIKWIKKIDHLERVKLYRIHRNCIKEYESS